MFTFVKGTIKSGFGIKCSHACHTFTHRFMAAIHSGDRYPYSCVAMGMSVIPEDYFYYIFLLYFYIFYLPYEDKNENE